MFTGLITKTIVNIALILITVVAGIILHKAGKPYNTGLFTVHKLATVAFAVLIIRMVIACAKNYGLNFFTTILLILSAVSVLGLLISGGAMSLNKSHELMLTIHRISTAVFLLSISGLFYEFFHLKH